MSKQTLKKLAFSILTTALMVAFVGAFTQKTSKKESPSSVRFKDVVEKVSEDSIQLKDTSKFELVTQDGKLVVREKSTRRLVVGSAGCSACPGGQCRTIIFGQNRGSCKGCGERPNNNCTIKIEL